MYQLILKDVLLLKKILLLILGFIVFFFILENPPAFAVAIAGFIYISNSGSFDDRSHSNLMWNSLPISRAKIVSAKYVSIIIFGLFIKGLVTVLQGLLYSVLNMYEQPFPEANQLIIGFLIVLIVASVYYPIYYKFGEKYARILMMIAVFGTVILGNMVWHLVSQYVENILQILSQYSSEQLIMFGIILTLLFFASSWLLSIKIYKEKDF
ncbi:ABC-2 transporter permease [Bacillus sp. Bva_UNVM-123]|uniref:ABC-2 transporter permease n=1 Tax=Bacillus sp. Bva_UNVM-123 TaxID=2829798 RepID=UPI00391FA0E8